MWDIFFVQFQSLPVDDCSAVSYDSDALTRGSEHMSFYSTILNQSLKIILAFNTVEERIFTTFFLLTFILGL